MVITVKRLTKEQVDSIPERLKEKSIKRVADDLGVSSRAIDYQIVNLRQAGVEITLKRGRRYKHERTEEENGEPRGEHEEVPGSEGAVVQGVE